MEKPGIINETYLKALEGRIPKLENSDLIDAEIALRKCEIGGRTQDKEQIEEACYWLRKRIEARGIF